MLDLSTPRQAPTLPATPTPHSVHFGADRRALHAVALPHVEAACWQRALPQDLIAPLHSLASLDPTRCRATHTPHSKLPLKTMLQFIPSTPAQQWLHDDLTTLCDTFAELCKLTTFTLELELTRSDDCKKLHVDSMLARLICTYAGPATEWLHPSLVNHSALGQHSHDLDTANALIAQGHPHQHLNTGDVLLFKGRLWPNARGLVHRSPPIQHLNAWRFIAKISP